jgi:FkbM family methyltransferase
MKWRYLHRVFKARFRDQSSEIRLAQSVLRPGDLAVDAGANKGAYLYWLRRAVGADGRVIAFEPQPALAGYLEAVRTWQRWNNVEIRPVALSSKAGTGVLHVPGVGNSPGASLESAVAAEHPGHSLSCAIDTLDQQLRGLGPVRFLKVDVEGHELELFRGAIQRLMQDQPFLLFECEARHLRTHTMRHVFDFLEELNYRGFLIAGSRLLPVVEFDAQIHQRQDRERFWDAPGYFNNFAFSPPALLEKELAAFIHRS